MVKAFYDFQTTKLADYTGKLKSGDWCLGDKAYTRSGSSGSYTYTPLEKYNYSSRMVYDASTRLERDNANGYQPTLKCNGTVLDKFATVSGVSIEAPMYVSAITADEIVYAGGIHLFSENKNYYLINDYQKSNFSDFWSLSPSGYFDGDDFAFSVYNRGYIATDVLLNNHEFRPSIQLKSSIEISSGEGTLEKPYVIG